MISESPFDGAMREVIEETKLMGNIELIAKKINNKKITTFFRLTNPFIATRKHKNILKKHKGYDNFDIWNKCISVAITCSFSECKKILKDISNRHYTNFNDKICGLRAISVVDVCIALKESADVMKNSKFKVIRHKLRRPEIVTLFSNKKKCDKYYKIQKQGKYIKLNTYGLEDMLVFNLNMTDYIIGPLYRDVFDTQAVVTGKQKKYIYKKTKFK